MNNHQEHIDQYLSGAMEEKDKQSFLRLLEEEPALRQELEEQEKLADMIRLAAMHDELQSIHAQMDAHPVLTRRPLERIPGKWWLAAAAILLLVIAGDYFLVGHYRSPEKKIFAAWYEPEPGLATTMGAGQSDNRLMDAMVDYKTKEYASAIGKFKVLLPNPSTLSSTGTGTLSGTDTAALFYLAASFMGAGQYDSSYLFFGKLAGVQQAESPDHYTQAAQWYEALSCLRLKRIAEARSILQEISGAATHSYREKALKLSKELSAL